MSLLYPYAKTLLVTLGIPLTSDTLEDRGWISKKIKGICVEEHEYWKSCYVSCNVIDRIYQMVYHIISHHGCTMWVVCLYSKEYRLPKSIHEFLTWTTRNDLMAILELCWYAHVTCWPVIITQLLVHSVMWRGVNSLGRSVKLDYHITQYNYVV